MARDKKYLARVRRYLTCSAASRRRLLAQAGQLVEDFCQENPGADEAALAAAFGAPREFAAQMLTTLEPEELAAAKRRRRGLFKAAACCAVVLAVLGAGWSYLYWHPEQRVSTHRSAGVSYPQITFHPYNRLGLRTPPKLALQSTLFNDTVWAFEHTMWNRYGGDFTLDYRLERGKDGTNVIFTGQGTRKDGTAEPIEESLFFDIVIRADAKWS